MFTCPVCYFEGLTDPPRNYTICDCCGTEFENDDDLFSHEELRDEWIRIGTPWFYGAPPHGWNPAVQLLRANVRVKRMFVVKNSQSVSVTSGCANCLQMPFYEAEEDLLKEFFARNAASTEVYA